MWSEIDDTAATICYDLVLLARSKVKQYHIMTNKESIVITML